MSIPCVRPVIVKVRYRHVRMGNRVSGEEYMSSIEATPSPGQTTRFMCSRECVVSIDYFTPIVRCREKSRFRSSSK